MDLWHQPKEELEHFSKAVCSICASTTTGTAEIRDRFSGHNTDFCGLEMMFLLAVAVRLEALKAFVSVWKGRMATGSSGELCIAWLRFQLHSGASCLFRDVGLEIRNSLVSGRWTLLNSHSVMSQLDNVGLEIRGLLGRGLELTLAFDSAHLFLGEHEVMKAQDNA